MTRRSIEEGPLANGAYDRFGRRALNGRLPRIHCGAGAKVNALSHARIHFGGFHPDIGSDPDSFVGMNALAVRDVEPSRGSHSCGD